MNPLLIILLQVKALNTVIQILKLKGKNTTKIKNNGGNINGYIIDYPIGNAESDMKHVKTAFSKNLTKADIYRQRFQCIGFAILTDCSQFIDKQWGKNLSYVSKQWEIRLRSINTLVRFNHL